MANQTVRKIITIRIAKIKFDVIVIYTNNKIHFLIPHFVVKMAVHLIVFFSASDIGNIVASFATNVGPIATATLA